MIILLLGLMGSGKTTVGKILSNALNYNFVEMDHMVLDKTGFNSISEVYEHRMSLWKESELEISKELSKKENLIIAACGGLAENQLNILYFQENSPKLIIIDLEVEIEEAKKRLLRSANHTFTPEEEVKMQANLEKIAKKRNYLNALYANYIIDTTVISMDEATEKILDLLK